MNILENKILGESIKSFNVNGLNVYVLEKKEFSNISVSFFVKYGSNDISFKYEGDENFKRYPLGIAHFLEHKMFDGNGNDEIFDRFSKIGAYINAYTSCNTTNYYFDTVDNFDKSLEYLCSMIYNMKLTEESVEREKSIIEQELKMYEDDPYSKLYRNLLSTMYDTHPMKYDIGGDVDSIKIIKKSDLEDCYNTFYSNDNMCLVLVGNVDANHCQEMLDNYIPNKIGKKVIREKFDNFEKVTRHRIVEDMNMSIPTNLIGFKDMDSSTDHIKKLLIFQAIHRMYFRSTSDFYENIYKDKIIDNSYYAEYINESNCGHYLFGGDGDEFQDLPDRIFDYYKNYDFYKDIDKFSRIKRSLYGNYINLFNNINNISSLMIKCIRNDATIFNYFDELNKITLDDVVETFKNIFKEENMVYSRVN